MKTIEELLVEFSEPYTREQFEADRARLLTAIAFKHGIVEDEVDKLVSNHDYVHSFADPEDEYIGIMSMARHAGWV